MTDKYKELREALESGPTPGEWKQVDDLPYLHAFKEGQKTNHHFEVPCIGRFDYSPVDMKYIAAANPVTIRALLDERDRLREALEMISGDRMCIDPLMRNVDIARAALTQEQT